MSRSLVFERLRSIAFALAALLAHTTTQAQITLHDDRNATLAFRESPQRIVSLLPSLTESICALGACSRLVGVDRFSNFPASILTLPKVGGLEDAQIERIVALKPDVVLASTSARVIDRLEALGIKVLVVESRNHADVKRTLALLAQMLGTPAAADAVGVRIEQDLREAQARVPRAVRGQRVYFEVDATPYAAGPGSFIGETLARLGMANAIPAELGPFPKLNPEYVVRAQPDIIIAVRQNIADMPRRPGWGVLRALQSHRTCGFEGERYDMLVRPGPRMGEAALLLADCLAALPATSP